VQAISESDSASISNGFEQQGTGSADHGPAHGSHGPAQLLQGSALRRPAAGRARRLPQAMLAKKPG
jgi:hypothetical protein